MKHEFRWYVHDESLRESTSWVADRDDVPVEVVKKVAELNPFYEVELICSYDDETNETTLRLASDA